MEGLVYRTATQSEDDPLEYVLSDETIDRYGDIITAAGWDLEHFRNNPIALFNHSSDAVVGRWENVRVEGTRLIGRLALAAAGTSQLVDDVRRLVGQKILRAVSVGFRSLSKEKLGDKASDFWGPFRYLRQELVECSLVAVPANPNALQVARSFPLSVDVSRQLFGEPAKGEPSRTPAAHGVTARPFPRRSEGSSQPGRTPMSLTKRIETAQRELTGLRDQLTELARVEQPNDEEAAQIDELTGTLVPAAVKSLERLQQMERTLAVQLSSEPDAARPNGGSDQPQRLYAMPAKKIRPADLIVRRAVCNFVAHVTKQPVTGVQQQLYGQDEALGWIVRAAVDPAKTTVPAWAGELAREAIADFMDLLMPESILGPLSAMGASLNFGAAGSIRIPSRLSTPNVAGAFIAEGDPIPVKKLGLTSIVLTPKKAAVISAFTREMAMHSTPQIEGVIRDAMVEDTAAVVDGYLIDDQAATTARPAGLLNGVTPIAADTTESDPLAMMADIKNLVGAILANNGGRNVAILLNRIQALAIVTQQTTTGDFLFGSLGEFGTRVNVRFIASNTVPAKTLIAVDAADFVTTSDETPEFDVSDQATLHMEDTTPLPIIGGTTGTPAPAVPTRSLWQTASIGIRMLWDVNWAMRRAGMVSYVENVSW